MTRVISSSDGIRRRSKLTPGPRMLIGPGATLSSATVATLVCRAELPPLRAAPPQHGLSGHAADHPRERHAPCRPSRARTRWRSPGVQMRFPMAHGAAIITERSIGTFYRKAIGELCAFINGARTLEELAVVRLQLVGLRGRRRRRRPRAGWSAGDLGPGSYGHAFHNFTTDLDGDDPGFDQLPHIIEKLRDLPLDRTALISPWIPQANHRTASVKSRNTIAPCHGWVHFLVFGDKLHVVHNQRSGRHADRRAVEHGPVHGAGADGRAADGLRVRRVRALDPVRAHLREPARACRRDALARAAPAADACR